MENDLPDTFKSREEFAEAFKQKHEIEVFFFKISISCMLIYLFIDGTLKFTLNFTPITFALNKYYWPILIVGVFLYVLWTRSERYERNRTVYARCAVIKQYEKTKEALEGGLESKSKSKIQIACEQLEEMEDFFPEMLEYRELLEKGGNWLRERNISTNEEEN